MLALFNDLGSKMWANSDSNVRQVTVISSEQPGSAMAGPAIRAVNLAIELQRSGLAVKLAVPAKPNIELPVPITIFGKPSSKNFRELSQDADIVVTQPQRLDVARGLHKGGAKIIYDLYVPSYVEYPASIGLQESDLRANRLRVQRNWMEYAAAIASGDAFMVATPSQGDYLLGALGQTGRLQDLQRPGGSPPTVVVPFGLPDEQPGRVNPGPLRGQLVPKDSIIAVWTGGLWNWFDPVTVIRGLSQARRSDPRLHLVFLGSRNPTSSFLGQGEAEAALKDPEIEAVFTSGGASFASDWVPYNERWNYLSDADFAVSAHLDTLETRMSFRTRLLDPLWAALPTLTTEGGELSKRMCQADAARCLPAQDSGAWSEAMLELAANPSRRSEMSAAARDLAADYRWSVATQPLIELIANLVVRQSPAHSGPGAVETMRYLSTVAELRLRR